jgi:ribosomal protein S18 acetylase RimI-like enzyme
MKFVPAGNLTLTRINKMNIRLMRYSEALYCSSLVGENWGAEAQLRARDQMAEYFNGGHYAPVFVVADATVTDIKEIAGFGAYQPSMKMKGSYDLIWLTVNEKYRGGGAGTALTEWRIEDIKKRGGQMIELVTQKPDYFSKFGFFKLHHLGNEWYLMLKLLKEVDI